MSLNDFTHADQQHQSQPPDWKAARQFFDSFESVRIPDRTKSFRPVQGKQSQDYLHVLYAASDIAEKCVDFPVNEAMRETIVFNDQNEEKHLFLDKYHVWQKIGRAWKDARLSGGAALFVNVNDRKTLDKPFDIKSSYTFDGLVPITRYKLIADPSSVIDDLQNPDFGLPEYFQMTTRTSSLRIHRSRLIIFDGSYLPEDRYIANGYWHQSILANIEKVIKDFDICHTNIAELIREANFIVMKVPNLKSTAALTEESKQYGDYLKSRVKKFNEDRDRSGTLLADKDEEISILNANLQGMSDLLDRSKRRLQMAVRIPAPILFNESPGSSMSANGSSEQSFWYDFLESQRKEILEPRLNRILDVIIGSSNKSPATDDWEYSFVPFFQMSETEKLQNESSEAQTASTLITSQVLDPLEVREYYLEHPKWSRFMSKDPQED